MHYKKEVFIPIPDLKDRMKMTRREYASRIFGKVLTNQDWRMVRGSLGLWVDAQRYARLEKGSSLFSNRLRGLAPLPKVVFRVKQLAVILLVFFLSSPVYASRHAYAGVTTAEIILMLGEVRPVWAPDPKPVPYVYYDTAVAMDGWHKLYEQQHDIGVYEEILNDQQRGLDRARRKLATADFEGMRVGLGMALLTIGLMISTILGIWRLANCKPKGI